VAISHTFLAIPGGERAYVADSRNVPLARRSTKIQSKSAAWRRRPVVESWHDALPNCLVAVTKEELEKLRTQITAPLQPQSHLFLHTEHSATGLGKSGIKAERLNFEGNGYIVTSLLEGPNVELQVLLQT
jgi:hypothetical protein